MTGSGHPTWRLIRTGPGNASFQMALDEVLLRAFSTGNGSPVFRVYEWSFPAITVGYAQRSDGLIDLKRCDEDGVAVVRRLTGGRALYHHHDLGYAVIGSADDPVFGGTILDTYRAINRVIAEAFSSCGIEGVAEESSPDRHVPVGLAMKAPCFAAPTKFELTFGGYKIAGSAQRRFRNVFLQQGSISLGSGAELITGYLLDRVSAEVYRSVLAAGSAFVPPNIDIGSFTETFLTVFRRRCTTASPDDLDESERHEAEQLARKQYGGIHWRDGDEQPADF
jgi:lipoyl(octanoyl) transferase